MCAFRKLIFALALVVNALNVFAADQPETLKIGAQAPDFNLMGVDGERYSLKSFADADVLAIVFTCNHCPTAQAYEERIKKLTADYKGKKMAMVAISSNDPKAILLDELGYTDLSDTYDEMKIRAKDMAYNFPYLYDGDDQKIALAYGPVATPHIFIFDKARKLQYNGRIDDVEKPTGTPKNLDARNAIEALLAGKPVPVASTKTFGCSMKWAAKEDNVKKEQTAWAKEPVTLEVIDEAALKELIQNKSDKLRLINVWATWCGPCVTEFPDFMVMHHMYRRRDFEFISISADNPDKKEKALKFLQGKFASNQNYIFNVEDKYKLIEAVDPKWQGALPYTILVEPGGKIVYSQQGPIDPAKMKKMIVENKYVGRYY
ncbi:redoxin domain-containing protein [Dyadobacter fermentans]|uniref:Alkyl hydroperoxide reductase/ Thiol specific antioxidant/ Mal allergen n=1 Tax=Dyadobacter fermentans (strain ATCC 700827 / DSM 18053 / CIP 107007 / KCTC 52180 / NS114) TaxID=471854 RepID=C6VX82_DYAFD|nr:redoxin domain-containing protein [Dyadobacter fermentans]ACT91555.1 alkyl hydroperoxide reductase/ Thiol specific antioxidant/ Mal allergen [Dyadobacter fermentans DSM 18053]